MVFSCPQSVAKNDAPSEVLSSYDLAFEDTFGNPAQPIDPAKWNTSFLWGPDLTINNEEQRYTDVNNGDAVTANPFSINAAGNLLITASPIPDPKPVTTSGIAGGQNYSSGIITTRDSMSFTYGYAEVCLRMPCGVDGAWPATWLLNTNYYQNAAEKAAAEGIANPTDKFNPEIDFWEGVQGDNNTLACANNAYHYYTGDQSSQTNFMLWSIDESNHRQYDVNAGQVVSQFNQSFDCDGLSQFRLPPRCMPPFCDDFHTVGVHWTPEFLKYYVDGQIVNSIAHDPYDLSPDQRMYLLINFAVGGSYPFGNPPSRLADPASYPASLEVEYARIYTP